ncbi:hypothetical protein P7K49_023594 [Saguinus oedipus]|uniref:Ras-associating domain-containing protein n=1 Tax=Saguinus oedipus TaxID=9490 RepID=A0ABQ9UM65_SAGOE|nr:hypothetical protein P7K49_023594 [Saguinus oedipus]
MECAVTGHNLLAALGNASQDFQLKQLPFLIEDDSLAGRGPRRRLSGSDLTEQVSQHYAAFEMKSEGSHHSLSFLSEPHYLEELLSQRTRGLSLPWFLQSQEVASGHVDFLRPLEGVHYYSFPECPPDLGTACLCVRVNGQVEVFLDLSITCCLGLFIIVMPAPRPFWACPELLSLPGTDFRVYSGLWVRDQCESQQHHDNPAGAHPSAEQVQGKPGREQPCPGMPVVEDGPSEFSLYIVHESGAKGLCLYSKTPRLPLNERTKLKDCEYPLISRILHGPCEKIARMFLMEADLGVEVPHDVSGG